MSERADLLEFVLPGVVHAIGNVAFVVEAQAQLGPRAAPERASRALGDAGRRAREVLDVLRALGADAETDGLDAVATATPFEYLQRVGEIVRVPLRLRGLRVAVEHGSIETPALVDRDVFVPALVAVTHRLAAGVTSGARGTMQYDLTRQSADRVELRIHVEPDPAALPFPIELAHGGPLPRHGTQGGATARPTADGRGVVLSVPAIDVGRSSAPPPTGTATQE